MKHHHRGIAARNHLQVRVIHRVGIIRCHRDIAPLFHLLFCSRSQRGNGSALPHCLFSEIVNNKGVSYVHTGQVGEEIQECIALCCEHLIGHISSIVKDSERLLKHPTLRLLVAFHATVHIGPLTVVIRHAINREFLLHTVFFINKHIIVVGWLRFGLHPQLCPHGIGSIINERLFEVTIVGNHTHIGKRNNAHHPIHGWPIDAMHSLVEHDQINQSRHYEQILKERCPVAHVRSVAKATAVGHGIGYRKP